MVRGHYHDRKDRSGKDPMITYLIHDVIFSEDSLRNMSDLPPEADIEDVINALEEELNVTITTQDSE